MVRAERERVKQASRYLRWKSIKGGLSELDRFWEEGRREEGAAMPGAVEAESETGGLPLM